MFLNHVLPGQGKDAVRVHGKVVVVCGLRPSSVQYLYSTLLGCVSSVQYLYIHVPIRQPRLLCCGSAKARSPCAVSVHTQLYPYSSVEPGSYLLRPGKNVPDYLLTYSFRVGAGLGGNRTALNPV